MIRIGPFLTTVTTAVDEDDQPVEWEPALVFWVEEEVDGVAHSFSFYTSPKIVEHEEFVDHMWGIAERGLQEKLRALQ